MTSTMCYVFLTVTILHIVSVDSQLDPSILTDVFGSNPKYTSFASVAAESSAQVVAVTPENDTLVDPDYWDFDGFQPALADYDKFDWTLTKHISSFTNGNFLLSPLGLKLALAILTEAATGPTRSELASVLGFNLDRAEVRRKFAAIIDSLKKESPEYILNLGSRIYVGENARPRQRFAAIAQEFYKTELTPTDFSNPSVAANDINTWVSNITNGRIPNLVDADDIAGTVVMILNTLYFKGTWRHQFPPNATKSGPFYVTPKVQKSVDFMHIKEDFYYVESSKFDAKMLRMPYRSNKFATYIVVPNSLTGLPRVLDNLSDLRHEIGNLRERYVEVTMPKFKFEFTSRLDSVLQELGIRQAFEDTASFPGIARGQLLHERLKVSKVLQRSGIEVNENGSVAYSATEIGIVNKFGEDDMTYEIKANRPFLFFIQDENTHQLLFTGRVADPSLVNGAY